MDLRTIFVQTHIISAYVVLVLAILTLATTWSLKLQGGPLVPQLKRALMLTRLSMWVTILSFLTGGYLATPYFQAGVGWVWVKLFLFIALAAIQGAMGTKSLKRALRLATQSDMTYGLGKAVKRSRIFAWVQLGIVSLLFLIAYSKPF